MRQSYILSFFIYDMEELIVLVMFFFIHITVGSLFITSFLPWKRKYVHAGSKMLQIQYCSMELGGKRVHKLLSINLSVFWSEFWDLQKPVAKCP